MCACVRAEAVKEVHVKAPLPVGGVKEPEDPAKGGLFRDPPRGTDAKDEDPKQAKKQVLAKVPRLEEREAEHAKIRAQEAKDIKERKRVKKDHAIAKELQEGEGGRKRKKRDLFNPCTDTNHSGDFGVPPNAHGEIPPSDQRMARNIRETRFLSDSRNPHNQDD